MFTRGRLYGGKEASIVDISGTEKDNVNLSLRTLLECDEAISLGDVLDFGHYLLLSN